MNSKKRILVAPLNWGLGHAARCIPIINSLLKHNFKVILSANGRSLHLLKEEFPELEFVKIKGIDIKYPRLFPMSISLFFQMPKILFAIYWENKTLKKIVEKHKIDGIISDNRFGLFHRKVTSVFITHQLQIQSPYLKNFIQKINYYFINKFNMCWVMDDEKQNLAGELSKPDRLRNNYKYIGLHSRLELTKKEKKYKLCFILSGPEPQRTSFEKIVMKSVKGIKEEIVIILGKTEDEKRVITENNLTIISSSNTSEINKYILESEIIISRSGYSTIMDLYKLNAKAIFIPTPGQTEQEYLAQYLKKNKTCYYEKQNKFNLERSLKNSKNYSGFNSKENLNNWEELFFLFKNK
ncbi:glycosyltransferase [Flavobacteriales bacterium]|nr:glycosyltransferase [Flavobacteriales bacterium]